ncbi:MAG: polysaccharide biosynthesis/export family protein [Acidobacteriota bacterium]
MKKSLTYSLVLMIAMAITAGTFAQSPTSSTRQRRSTSEAKQDPATADKPTSESAAKESDKTGEKSSDKATDNTADKPSDPPTDKATDSKDKTGPFTADPPVTRADPSTDEAAIVQNYNNFFTTYQLGPEDIISVTVFGQDRYSKGGIKIPPSGRISLALIPDGIFVNGKTVDQVAELIKKRYDEYIIDPQVSVSLDQAGSYRYSVIGDVAQPGIRLMTRRLSVTEAISEAGGILQTGDKKKVFVLRKQAKGNLTPIPVNVSAIYRGQAPDSVYLLPGDQVIVPGNSLKKWQTLTSFLPVLSFAKIFTGGW